MLERNTLFACPSCARHVFPSELECPGCGARLRGADGTFPRTRVALAMGLGAVVGLGGGGGGCGDSTGAGGGGTSASTSSPSSSATKGTTTQTTGMVISVSAYGSGPTGWQRPCDDGMQGTIDSQLCGDCIDCSLGAGCSDELAVFGADPDAQDFVDCITPCQDTACEDACAAMYPNTATAYYAVLSCAVCLECPNNCDAATNCQ